MKIKDYYDSLGIGVMDDGIKRHLEMARELADRTNYIKNYPGSICSDFERDRIKCSAEMYLEERNIQEAWREYGDRHTYINQLFPDAVIRADRFWTESQVTSSMAFVSESLLKNRIDEIQSFYEYNGVFDEMRNRYEKERKYFDVLGLNGEVYLKEINDRFGVIDTSVGQYVSLLPRAFESAPFPDLLSSTLGFLRELQHVSKGFWAEDSVGVLTEEIKDEEIYGDIEKIFQDIQQEYVSKGGLGYRVYFKKLITYIGSISEVKLKKWAIFIVFYFLTNFILSPFASNSYNAIVAGNDVRIIKKFLKNYPNTEDVSVASADITVAKDKESKSPSVGKIVKGAVVREISMRKKLVLIEGCDGDGMIVCGWVPKKYLEPVRKRKERKKNHKTKK